MDFLKSSAPVSLLEGDCLEVMAAIEADTFDAIVTDPPYHLTSIVKRFGGSNAAAAKGTAIYGNKGAQKGFMGKEWDGGDITFRAETWAEMLRIAKPGAHLVAFNHSRTWHHMAVAIEASGWEIRDSLMWLYGTGFPKSHDVPRGLEKLGAPPESCANWQGWGTALKPAFEPIVLARKPLSESSIARQHLATGTGGLNIDSARVDGPEWTRPGSNAVGGVYGDFSNDAARSVNGRWPANVVHDGSPEVLGQFPADPQGSAARFFYSAKADARDRAGSDHPTVKPQELMKWLVRLVTPRGGLLLDPFGGSGSTGWAAATEGRRAVMIERDPAYQGHIRRRLPDFDPARLSALAAERDAAKDDGAPQLSLF